MRVRVRHTPSCWYCRSLGHRPSCASRAVPRAASVWSAPHHAALTVAEAAAVVAEEVAAEEEAAVEEEEAAVEEEEEEEETLQKITKEDHATARPTSCPNTGRILCALLRSRPATAARAATLRHSVTLHIRSLTRTLGPSSATSAGERRTLEWSASWLGCQG